MHLSKFFLSFSSYDIVYLLFIILHFFIGFLLKHFTLNGENP